MKDELKEFGDIEVKNIAANSVEDIDFLCHKPKDCSSFQEYGYSCKCIRRKFDSPSAFKHWLNTYSKIIETDIKKIIGDNE